MSAQSLALRVFRQSVFVCMEGCSEEGGGCAPTCCKACQCAARSCWCIVYAFALLLVLLPLFCGGDCRCAAGAPPPPQPHRWQRGQAGRGHPHCPLSTTTCISPTCVCEGPSRLLNSMPAAAAGCRWQGCSSRVCGTESLCCSSTSVAAAAGCATLHRHPNSVALHRVSAVRWRTGSGCQAVLQHLCCCRAPAVCSPVLTPHLCCCHTATACRFCRSPVPQERQQATL